MPRSEHSRTLASQAHGSDCTEEFYRDQIRGELESQGNSHGRSGLGGLLRNVARLGLGSDAADGQHESWGPGFRRDDAEEEEEEEAGEERTDGEQAGVVEGNTERSSLLRGLASAPGASLSPNVLTPEERVLFAADVAAGRVVPAGASEWLPWWSASEAAHVAAARRRAAPVPVIVEVAAPTAAPAAAPAAPNDESIAVQQPASERLPGASDCSAIGGGGEGAPGSLLFASDLRGPLPCVLPGPPSVYLHSPACAAIPPFRRIAGQRVSPTLPFMLAEMLCAYALVHRRCLGDCIGSDAVAACSDLLAASPALLHDRRYESLPEALSAAAEAAQSPSVRASAAGHLGGALVTLRDVADLLSCRHFVVDALFDARQVVLGALAALREAVAGGDSGGAPTEAHAANASGGGAAAGDSAAPGTPLPQAAAPAVKGASTIAAGVGRVAVRGRQPVQLSSSASRRLAPLVAAERKLLFYCSWAAEAMDPLLELAVLRKGVISWAREVAPSWEEQPRRDKLAVA
jgi:hypothetical protein